MNNTEYKIKDKQVTYAVTEDGYDIYLDGKRWIAQHEPNIPYPELGYKGSCLKQIDELSKTQTASQEDGNNTQERIQALEKENAALSATLDDLLTNIIPAINGEVEVM